MMIRAAATDPFSLADAATVLVGLFVVGAVVFCISMCAEDSPSIADFLHRTQAEADASRFQELLGALGEPSKTAHLVASAESSASHVSRAAVQTNAVLESVPMRQPDRGDGDADRDQLRAMYDRAIGPGVLKPRQAAGAVRRNGVDL